MKDSIIVYSLPTCGMCRMLKNELTKKSIPFVACESIEEMEKMGIAHVPVLSVSGTLYSFKEALTWVKEQ